MAINVLQNPHYQRLGGEEGVRRLVERFYDIMEQDPAASHIRSMHPEDMQGSREKLFMFLSGWLGGPDLYIQKYGHPRLKARHLPFSIGEEERDAWMRCMQQALEDCGVDEKFRRELIASFFKTADFMRNR